MLPLLFNIYAAAMTLEAMEGVEEGVIVGGKLLKGVRFADDQGMVAGSIGVNSYWPIGLKPPQNLISWALGLLSPPIF